MEEPNPNLFRPAATMTKLEAVAIELFARQMVQRSQSFLNPEFDQFANWSIEAAETILTILDLYQEERESEFYQKHKVRERIVQVIHQKNLQGKPLRKILSDRYKVEQICDLTSEGEADLADYLESL